MTGVKPYQGIRDGPLLYRALTQDVLPGQTALLETPDFVKRLLSMTWTLGPDSRPSMRHCAKFLSECISITRVFSGDEVAQLPPQVPMGYQEDGEGWTAIHNPKLPLTLQISASGTKKLSTVNDESVPSH